jgi:hypothetical protein
MHAARAWRLPIGGAKDGLTGHENVRAGSDDLADVRLIDAAIDLDEGRRAGGIEQCPHASHFIQAVRNECCPPKPGFTDITSTKSTSGAIASSDEAGVPGLSTTPALAPSLRMNATVRFRCRTASTCTETMLAPAATNSSM